MKNDRCDVCEERIVTDPGSRVCEECKEQARLVVEVTTRYLEKVRDRLPRFLPEKE